MPITPTSEDTPDQWWLRGVTPTDIHMWWIGEGPYADDGFAAIITLACADWPPDWSEDTGWSRAVHSDPHPSLFVGATIHERGWAPGQLPDPEEP